MMRRTWVAPLLGVLFSVVAAGPAAAQLTQGNVVVLRVGDGTTALGTGTTQTSLVQFTPAGTQVGSPLVLPLTITNTGNSTTEGALSLSADRRFLLFGSYLTAAGNVASTGSAATFPRAIVRVDAGGNVASFGLGATAFDTSNIRSATSTNGVDMWAAGNSGTAGNGGTWYNNGTAATQISSTQNNSRVVSVQNNTLFYSSGSGAGAAIGINSLGSPPPTSGPVSPSAFLNGVTGQLAAPMEFALSPGPISAGSFLYLTDQAAAATAVQRFNFDGTSWTLAYNFSGATTTSGVAVDFSGPSPVIYATAPTGLFTAIDAGVAGTLTSIATPGANFAFRGVAFAPVPEPAHVFLLCAAAAGAVHCWRRRKATAQTAAM